MFPSTRPRPLTTLVRHRTTLTMAALAVAVSMSACDPAPSAATPVPASRAFATTAEATPQYQPASMPCDPADSFDKPGPMAFRDLLLATYGPTWSGTLRACDGSRSEHNEGRALDWGMDYSVAAQRTKGQAMINWLRATDANGTTNAMAHRLGIQYWIWNKQMYGSWNNFAPGPYACNGSPTDCHINHVHISFTWTGAQKMTSFWTGAALPAAMPGAIQTVSATSAAPAVMPRSLLPGVSYTVESSGTYKFGALGTQAADANCSVRNGVWSATSGRTSLFGAADLKLSVDDSASPTAQAPHAWVPTINTGGGCNTRDHRYRMTLSGWQGQDLYAVVNDPVRSDNSGSLTVSVVSAR